MHSHLAKKQKKKAPGSQMPSALRPPEAAIIDNHNRQYLASSHSTQCKVHCVCVACSYAVVLFINDQMMQADVGYLVLYIVDFGFPLFSVSLRLVSISVSALCCSTPRITHHWHHMQAHTIPITFNLPPIATCSCTSTPINHSHLQLQL